MFFCLLNNSSIQCLTWDAFVLFSEAIPPPPPKKSTGKKIIGSSPAQNLDLSFCWQIVYIYSVCFFWRKAIMVGQLKIMPRRLSVSNFVALFLHPFAGSHGISLPTVAGQRRTIAAVLASMNPKLNDHWLVQGLLHPRYCHLYLVHMFVLIIAPQLQGWILAKGHWLNDHSDRWRNRIVIIHNTVDGTWAVFKTLVGCWYRDYTAQLYGDYI